MTTLTIVTTDEVKDFVKNASKSNGMTMSQFVSVILEKAAVNGAFYLKNGDIKAAEKYRNLPESSVESDERKRDMIRLRFREFWTLQQIADKYGLSRERVRQIIGNTGHGFQAAQTEVLILGQEEKTNGELAEETGLNPSTIAQYRHKNGERYKIDGDKNTPVKVGVRWEDWVMQRLDSMGFAVEGMPYGEKYDLLVNGWRVDVKAATVPNSAPSHTNGRYVSPQWRFHTGVDKRDNCDFYLCVTAEKDVFVIPSSKVSDNKSMIQFCYPTKRPSLGKYQKYHEAYHLLATPAATPTE